ncbi:MAG: Asp-tRNA(Asn)/Glu-tRNA(Gln) amidotransferase subunit GatC [Bdellovibrionaceae bacterium]|jgi:aspartyl-tRNA(Asn)/glutamyl-tRNA(Gln) amidotransferase subunit C|nr:Asp-tRNA(Asn)/Glu-tRNA(Gln) amidotransferase subunit GatC [Pseudobdellovibrionaceae bacterium]
MDKKTIEKVATLARLKLTPEEQQKMEAKLEQVLHHFRTLASVPTENVEPLVTPHEMTYVFREDVVQTDLNTEQALANAPSRQGDLFKVPPVI